MNVHMPITAPAVSSLGFSPRGPERRLNWKFVWFSGSRQSLLMPLTPLSERGPEMSDGIDTDGDKTENDKE